MLLEWLVRPWRKTQWYPFTSKKLAELLVGRQASDLPAVSEDTFKFLEPTATKEFGTWNTLLLSFKRII